MKAYDYARQFLGEKEKPNNGGFYHPKLQEIMTRAGHEKGEAWCMLFAEACFCEVLEQGSAKEKELRKLFSKSCVITFRNFQKSGKYVISRNPIPGALAIWQRYKDGEPTVYGHAGIILPDNCGDTAFETIEGNTNSDGSREGDSVQQKKRSAIFRPNGLTWLGCIAIEGV